MRRGLVGGMLIAMALSLAGCAIAPPTKAERMDYQSAQRPPSHDAAEQMVRNYFAPVIGVPQSAQYNFGPVVHSAILTRKVRLFGYSMCGQVAAVNGFGGYVNRWFMVHFDPTGYSIDKGVLPDYANRRESARLCRQVVQNAQPF